MTISFEHYVSISVVIIGVLTLLESIISYNGKGIDVNGELPLMVFGVLYIAFTPAYFKILGSFSDRWYLYVLIFALSIMAFVGYIKVKGFTVRFFCDDFKTVVKCVERLLKQTTLAYTKEVHTPKGGQIILYKLDSPKLPIQIMENRKTLFSDYRIDLLAPESLWNKEIMSALLEMVNTQRKRHSKTDAQRAIKKRVIKGLFSIAFGLFLLFF